MECPVSCRSVGDRQSWTTKRLRLLLTYPRLATPVSNRARLCRMPCNTTFWPGLTVSLLMCATNGNDNTV